MSQNFLKSNQCRDCSGLTYSRCGKEVLSKVRGSWLRPMPFQEDNDGPTHAAWLRLFPSRIWYLCTFKNPTEGSFFPWRRPRARLCDHCRRCLFPIGPPNGYWDKPIGSQCGLPHWYLDGGMSLSFPGPPLGLGTGPNHHEEVDIHRKGNKLRCYPQQLESFCFVSIFHSAVICTGTLQNRNRYLQRNPPEPNKVSASEPSGTSPGIPTNIMNWYKRSQVGWHSATNCIWSYDRHHDIMRTWSYNHTHAIMQWCCTRVYETFLWKAVPIPGLCTGIGAVQRIDCRIPGLCDCHVCNLREWWLIG